LSYDHWKTTDLSLERLEQLPPCETKPKYDDDDVCQYCGANPTQACQFNKERERP